MSSRTLKIVCAISILANIFLLGAIAGGAAWMRARQPMIGPGSMRIAGSELPPDERRAFRRALRTARREVRPTAMAGWQARADAAALLRAPTLDQKALGEALARVRAADLAVRTHVEARAIGFAATLPPADRARLADALERRRARMEARATDNPD